MGIYIFPVDGNYSILDCLLLEWKDIKKFEVKKASSLSYDVGDTVKHIKFGTGVVKSIIDGGRDYEVTVDFEKAGIKKMFASFAKLKKL